MDVSAKKTTSYTTLILVAVLLTVIPSLVGLIATKLLVPTNRDSEVVNEAATSSSVMDLLPLVPFVLVGLVILIKRTGMKKNLNLGDKFSSIGGQVVIWAGWTTTWWSKRGWWLLGSIAYGLLILGIYRLLPVFWSWLWSHGSFFFWWLIIGIPVFAILSSSKVKLPLARGLMFMWLLIVVLAANWMSFPHVTKAAEEVRKWQAMASNSRPVSTVTTVTRTRAPQVPKSGHAELWVDDQHWEEFEILHEDVEIHHFTDGPVVIIPPHGSPVKSYPKEVTVWPKDTQRKGIWRVQALNPGPRFRDTWTWD